MGAADDSDALLFVFPAVLFCAGRIGILSREAASGSLSAHPCCFHRSRVLLWAAISVSSSCDSLLLVQAGPPDFTQTDKQTNQPASIVSLLASTVKRGSLVFRVFLLGVWDGWE